MKIKDVKHIKNYILEVTFINGDIIRVNLRKYMFSEKYIAAETYRDIRKFKTARVYFGRLVWGPDEEFDLTGEDIIELSKENKNKSTDTLLASI